MKLFCLLGLSGLAAYLLYAIGKPFLAPILIALMLRIVFQPLYKRIRPLTHRDNLAAGVSTVVVLLLATVPLLVVGTVVRSELRDIAQKLREAGPEGGVSYALMSLGQMLTERFRNYLNLDAFDVHAALLRWVEQASRYLLSISSAVLGNLFSFVLDTVVVSFTLFLFFREGIRIRQSISELLPFDGRQRDSFLNALGASMAGNLYGILAVGAAQGMLTGLSFWVLGISAPVLWALVAGLASIVPFDGSALVWMPASLVLLLTGHWIKAVALLIWGAAAVGQIDSLVRPRVISAHAKMHPLLVFFALVGGTKAFGIVGILLGPIALSFVLGVFALLRSAEFLSLLAAENPPLVSTGARG